MLSCISISILYSFKTPLSRDMVSKLVNFVREEQQQWRAILASLMTSKALGIVLS